MVVAGAPVGVDWWGGAGGRPNGKNVAKLGGDSTMEAEAANDFASFSFWKFNTFFLSSNSSSVTCKEGPKRANDRPDDLTANEPNRNGRLGVELCDVFRSGQEPTPSKPGRRKKKQPTTMDGFGCQKKKKKPVGYRHRIDMSSPFWLAVELSRFLSSFGTRRTQSVWYIGWHFVRLVSRWWIESRVCEEGEKKTARLNQREKEEALLFGQTQPRSDLRELPGRIGMQPPLPSHPTQIERKGPPEKKKKSLPVTRIIILYRRTRVFGGKRNFLVALWTSTRTTEDEF